LDYGVTFVIAGNVGEIQGGGKKVQTKLSCHVASLYFWYPSQKYESRLDDRIHACLDAGCDGVEISNGPLGVLDWQPAKETLSRLRRDDVVLTFHAELDDSIGASIAEMEKKLTSLALPIYNIVFHPVELLSYNLSQLPWPTSIENMDSKASWGQTYRDVSLAMTNSGSVGFTYDTAHAMECNPVDFSLLFPPMEVHLSVSLWNGVSGANHVVTNGQSSFPYIPTGSSLVVLEGIMSDKEALVREIEYVREMLVKRGFS